MLCAYDKNANLSAQNGTDKDIPMRGVMKLLWYLYSEILNVKTMLYRFILTVVGMAAIDCIKSTDFIIKMKNFQSVFVGLLCVCVCV